MTITVTVPEGVTEGQLLAIGTLTVEVPAGHGPGDSFTVVIPPPWETLPEPSLDVFQACLKEAFVKGSTSDRVQGTAPTGLRVVKVEALQNPDAWERYTQARAEIGARRGICNPISPGLVIPWPGLDSLDASVNEVYLFLGSTQEEVTKIAENGFPFLYGESPFFAEASNKADENWRGRDGQAEPDVDGTLCLLICRLACGQVLDITPIKDPGEIGPLVGSGCFDSLLGERQGVEEGVKFREFCHFDAHRAVFPEWLVTYTRE
jgi:hypothetical protein